MPNYTAQDIKLTTLEFRPVSQTAWEWFIDFCFGNLSGPGNAAGIIQQVDVSLAAAQIKTSYSVPVDSGIPNPGAGKAIEFVSGSLLVSPGGTAFDTMTQLNIITDTANSTQATSGTIMQSTAAASTRFFIQQNNTNNQNQIVANKKLMIQADADSAGGNGSAKVRISYRIITT